MGQDLFKHSTDEYGYKIVLILKDGTAEIRESGVSKDIYRAIDRAHKKMLAKLHGIQDHVLSQEERMNLIQAALGNVHVH
jgi:ribosome-associated translation inhibitor RaiA